MKKMTKWCLPVKEEDARLYDKDVEPKDKIADVISQKPKDGVFRRLHIWTIVQNIFVMQVFRNSASPTIVISL